LKYLSALLPLFAICFFLSAQAGQAQYDSGDPTASEQVVLEIINRARANPTAEGTRLGININEGLSGGATALVQPPLAMNKILLGTARAHSDDMYTRTFFAHTNPSGKDPFQRIESAGYNYFAAGENIATGSSYTASALEDILMKDSGLPGRGHRVNLLDIGSSVVYREVGIGYHLGATPITIGNLQTKDFITQDFGTSATGPFILGVVFADANTNTFYDSGEGVSGITITPDSGSFFAVSATAGGYAIPVGTSGTITLTASGGSLSSPITKQVTLTGKNIKVDFIVNAGPSGTPPTITSPLSANATQFSDFTYSITATGTLPISFSATGLPSGLSLSGSTISGKPTQTGQFMITLKASNGSGSDTQTLVLNITAAVFVSNTTIDTDSDGFPDELETFLGTAPNNINSTPFAGAAAVPQPLSITTKLIKLNFAKTNSDAITLTGTLPILQGFAITGKTATLDVGGVLQPFTFGANGLATIPGAASFKIRIKSVKGLVAAQTAPFTIKLSKGSFSSALADEGLLNFSISTTVSVPVVLLFDQRYFNTTLTSSYVAKAQTSGLFK